MDNNIEIEYLTPNHYNMAITSNIEKELDREHEIYTEEPEIKNCLVIKHLVVKKEYRCLNIATELIENLTK